ncbi:hypothetical protein CEXT_107701 [Caerostris extrusa]|uniref:Uncharacterized protein n=1 Tax=Caerostris extrusa TaxID=172846 RepID=A0AAV4MVV1_CAEEX|nr:hypothetical protein CEXT_107701 [Caerostris extrusa]
MQTGKYLFFYPLPAQIDESDWKLHHNTVQLHDHPLEKAEALEIICLDVLHPDSSLSLFWLFAISWKSMWDGVSIVCDVNPGKCISNYIVDSFSNAKLANVIQVSQLPW